MLQKKITTKTKKKPEVAFSLEGIKDQEFDAKQAFLFSADLKQAQALHQKGDFKTSIALYKQILQKQPHCTQAALAISVLYNDLGQYQKAQIYFKQATQIKKKTNLTHLKNEVVQKYQELANIYSKHQQPQVAIQYQLTALALKPKDRILYIGVGENLIQLGQYSKAISIFKYLHSQDPQSYPIQFKLAQAYYKNKQVLQASIIWSNLFKQFPQKKEIKALNHLSQVLKVV